MEWERDYYPRNAYPGHKKDSGKPVTAWSPRKSVPAAGIAPACPPYDHRGSLKRVTINPLIIPRTAPMMSASRMATGSTAEARIQQAKRDGRHGQHRCDRQIDIATDNHEGHRQRHHADFCVEGGRIEDIVNVEEVRRQPRADEESDD